jgi:hypothetical protein
VFAEMCTANFFVDETNLSRPSRKDLLVWRAARIVLSVAECMIGCRSVVVESIGREVGVEMAKFRFFWRGPKLKF